MLILLAGCGKQAKQDETAVLSNSDIVNEWINVARDSAQMPLNTRKAYLRKATEKALSVSNDTVKLDHLSRISLAYKRLQDSVGFRRMNRRVLVLSTKERLFKAQGESHWDMASFFKSYGVMDSAFYQYQQALKSFYKLPVDSTSLSLRGRMLYSMGSIQDYFKDYLGAEVSATEALRIFEGLDDNIRIYNCNNLLGVVANGMNNQEKSLEYYQRAGSFIKKLSSPDAYRLEWQNKNNIAHVFLKNGEYSKSEKAYSELFKDDKFRKLNPVLYSRAMTSQAYAIFKGEKNFEEARDLVAKSIEINDSISFSEDQSRAKQYFAEFLAAMGDSSKARVNAKESLKLSRETSNTDQHLEVLRLLTTLDSKNAVSYSNEFYDLSEKVKEEERAKRDKFARIRLETDEVIQENEALTRGKLIWTLVAIAFFLTGAAIYIILAQRASNNALKYEQEQQEANQEIYNLMLSQQGKFEEGKKLEKKRISEELHDGVLSEMLGIRLFMSALNTSSDDDSIEQRANLIEQLRDVEEEIRTISHELSDASYQKFYNFIVSLEELMNTISETSGILCSFSYDEAVDWDDLEGDIKINTYRIVQESLKNCVKHAKAKKAEVSFVLKKDKLRLTIADDGVGFEVEKGKKGIGIRNLISRVQKMGGTLDIDSELGKGTTITVELPPKYIERNDPKDASERRQTINV